jgi:hypothetical protein
MILTRLVPLEFQGRNSVKFSEILSSRYNH